MADRPADASVLERVFAVIESRRGADPAKSYVAKRLASGTNKIAQKVGEEAVETVIAATAGSRQEVVEESVDLLFHLMMLWAERGVTPADIYAAVARREGVSGLDEKKSRSAT